MIKVNSRYAWFIWTLGASFFFLEYIVRVSPGVMVKELIAVFSINAYQLGLLSSAFSLSYIAMQIPVGTMVDKYSIRWLIGFMALLCSLSTALFASTVTFEWAVLSRFLIGITGAFAFVGALKIATLYFSPRHFGFLAGTTQALGMLGAAAGVGPLSIAVSYFSWRYTLLVLAVLIALLSMLIFISVRDNSMNRLVKEDDYSAWHGLLTVFKNPYSWLNVFIIGLLYAPTMVFAELWGPLYISRVYNVSTIQAASIVSVIFIGWAIGSPLVGWISDRLQRRKLIIVLSSGFSFLSLVVILYGSSLPIPCLLLAAFFYGFSNVGVSTCYVMACELNPHQYSGTALGFTNMASILLGALFQPIVGYLLDINWRGELFEGVRYYSSANLQTAMLALPICLLLCFILCCVSKESYGVSQ